ncbi:hypothetical protein [Glycomyces sp. NPDC021274]|uniref:hypothetical protein n=1 Tax=Glycomyces sp. NPDC021274 TaxID=3155120 RepID=UPI0033CBFDDC
MKALLRCIALVPLAFVSGVACATEPELDDDYATYEVSSDPIPLTPIPGADITAWTEAIEGLGIGEWSSSGDLIMDAYEPARAEPAEDPRVDEDRFSWTLQGTASSETADLIFTAKAVTDPDGGVLSMYCEVASDVYAADAPGGPVLFPFNEIRDLLQGCMSGSGGSSIGSGALSTWIDEQMNAAEAAYVTAEGGRFQSSNMVDAANSLVWFDSTDRQTSVSIFVDPRADAGDS